MKYSSLKALYLVSILVRKSYMVFGVTQDWVKWGIFLELPYWKTNVIHHNLDVMYIDKNMFDNILNTIRDVKDKTKDKIKAKMDLALY